MSFESSDGAVPFLFHTATSLRARHGFFGRAGGVSSGIYDSLNCGFGSQDEAAFVATNRVRAATALGIETKNLAAAYQVHGKTAILVDAGAPARREDLIRADALVTATPGIGLSILTADCLPVLMADEHGEVVGAAHAGWRGAADGVVGSTITLMREIGAGRITALIGPTIQQTSYQVGSDMREELLASIAPHLKDEAAECFQGEDSSTKVDPAPKYRFDLPRLVRRQLRDAGVEDIHDCAMDTYGSSLLGPSDSPAYFSHRRATHAKAADSGRQISIICCGV